MWANSASYWLGLKEWPLIVALAIGLLIGLERERGKMRGATLSAAGLRTFALVALLGAAVAATDAPGLILVTGGFVATAALLSYALGDRKDPGLTGEVAFIVTFVLGALAQTQAALSLEIGVVVATLLAFRVELHRLVRERITDEELRDGLAFAVAALVVLPLLPNRPIDPFGLINPSVLWRLAVLAMGLSFAGSLAQRIVGGRYGLLATGLAAGLVSSTAAVAAMGSRAKNQPTLTLECAAGAVASLIGSLFYLIMLIGAVSPPLVLALALPLGTSAVLVLSYATWLIRWAPKFAAKTEPVGKAFSIGAVLIFVSLVGGFSMASELLSRWLGAPGAVAGSAIMGLADAHASALSMATLLEGKQLSLGIAALGISVAVTTNMLIKIPTAFAVGGKSFAQPVTAGCALLVLGLWSGAVLQLRIGPNLPFDL